jgi:hypothetical protein
VDAHDWVALGRTLVWPGFVGLILIVYRTPAREFFSRLTRIRVAGQEFIAESLNTSTALLRSLPLGASRPESVPRSLEAEVVQLAADRSISRLAAVGNWREAMEGTSLAQRLLELSKAAGCEADAVESSVVFARLQDFALSNDGSLRDGEVRQLIQPGLAILGLINAVPRAHHIVEASDLPVYEDDQLTRRLEDRRAVLITTSEVDGTETRRAFLTSRPHYYKSGMSVGYEWRTNPPAKEGDGWARDPAGGSEPIHVIGWDFHGRDMAAFE